MRLSKNARKWSGGAAIGFALLLGASLLWLGIPRLAASFLLLPGDGPLKHLQQKKPVSKEKLEVLIRSRQQALDWVSSGRLWTDMALARLVAEETGARKANPQLTQAIANLKAGLAQAPANPFAWARLALAYHMVAGPSPKAASALVMSLETGPYEPNLISLRLELAFRNWAHLSRPDRRLARRQIRYGWQSSKMKIVGMARGLRRLAIIRGALSRNPNMRKAFEKLLEKARR